MKKIRKILIGMLAMVMLFGMSVTATASGKGDGSSANDRMSAAVAKITIDKAAPKTVYTDEGAKEFTVTYQTVNSKTTKGVTTYYEPYDVDVRSSNRGILKVEKAEILTKGTVDKEKNYAVTQTIRLTPVSNGTATITVQDKLSNKKATLKVTVKTHVTEIKVTEAAEDANVKPVKPVDPSDPINYSMDIAESGKILLKTSVNSNATDKKLKYESLDKTKVTVDAKGNVTGKKAGTAIIEITPNDKNSVKVRVMVEVHKSPKVNTLTLYNDTTVATAYGQLIQKGKNYSLNLYGNQTKKEKAYKLDLGRNLVVGSTDDVDYSDLLFVSSNEKVAKVNPKNGKIEATGNGTATITISPAWGNKVSTKISVKVNTLTDTMNVQTKGNDVDVLANNKDSVTVIGTTNQNASNKNVVYSISEIDSVDGKTTILDGKIKANKSSVNKYAAITNKGVLKAKQACTIVVRAESKADPKVFSEIKVKALTPVNTITIAPVLDDPSKTDAIVEKTINAKGTSATVYKTGKGTYNKLTLKESVTMKDNGGSVRDKTDADDVTIDWISSNPKVAEVKGGIITPISNGTAKITAKNAASGKSSAAFSVTVKTDAYKIVSPKAVVEEVSGTTYEDWVIYVVVPNGKDTVEVDYAKVIAAATNADATTKKLVYGQHATDDKGNPIYDPWGNHQVAEVKKETLSVGAQKYINVYATEGSHDNDNLYKKYWTAFRVDVINSVRAALTPDDFEFIYDPDNNGKQDTDPAPYYRVKADGDPLENPGWKVQPKGEKKPTVDMTAITWSVDNKACATVSKTGTVTGKKAGAVKVTATFKTPNKSGNSNVITKQLYQVAVFRSDKQVRDEFDKAFVAELNAENREYLGAKMTAKNKEITISVTDPDMTADKAKELGTGISEAVKNVVGPNVSSVTFKDGSDEWRAERTGGALLKVTNPDGSMTAEMDEKAAMEYIITELVGGRDVMLREWIGKSFDIEVGFKESLKVDDTDYGKMDYTSPYKVNVVLSDQEHKKMADADIAKAVEDVNKELKADGIAVTYDPATNAIAVLADKPSTKVAVLNDQHKDALIKILTDTLGDVSEATIDITLSGEPNGIVIPTIVKKRTDANSKEDYIKEIVDSYIAKLKTNAYKPIEEYGNIDGTIVSIKLSYVYGAISKDVVYTMAFGLTEDAYRNMVDELADGTIDFTASEMTRDVSVAGAYEYDKEANELTAVYADDIKLTDLVKGMGRIMDSMIGGAKVDKSGWIIIAMNGGARQSVAVTANKQESLFAIMEAFAIKTTKDLKDQVMTVYVPYEYDKNNAVALAYTIKFVVNDSQTQAITVDAVADDAEVLDAEAEEEILTEETEETTEIEEPETSEEENAAEESEEAEESSTEESVNEEIVDEPVEAIVEPVIEE